MTKTRHRLARPLRIDMTPMVDCATLLLIFFVLVIDVGQKQFEELVLPVAKYAQPDDRPPENRAIVNVTQDGRIVFHRHAVHDPRVDGADYARLHELVRSLRDDARRRAPRDAGPYVAGGRGVVDDPILVRADKWTEWHYIGKLLEHCVLPDVAFWKFELALAERDKEESAARLAGR